MFPPPFGSMFGGFGNDPFTEMDRMMNNMQRNMQQMQHQMMAAHSHVPAYAMQNQHHPQGPAYVQQAPRIEEIHHAAPSAPVPRHQASQEPIVEEPDEQGNYRPQQRARHVSPDRPAARNSVSSYAAPPSNGATTYYSSYSSSFSSSGGPNGVTYSSSTTTRMGPGGVMETRRVVSDGTTGQHVASLTHGLGGRQQTMVASRDASGRIVREQQLQGVAPGEAPEFEQQWSSMAQERLPGYHASMQQQQQQQQRQLALPQTGSSYSVQHQQHSSYGGYGQGPNGPWYS